MSQSTSNPFISACKIRLAHYKDVIIAHLFFPSCFNADGLKAERTTLRPAYAGLVFFVVSVAFILLGVRDFKSHMDNNYINYFMNFSWSLSLTFIFPIVITLTLLYYHEVPKLFESLFNNLTSLGPNGEIEPSKPGVEQITKDDYMVSILKPFNNRLSVFLIFFLSLIINFVHYVQVLNNEEERSNWIVDGEFYLFFIETKKAITGFGYLSFFVQLFLIFWVMIFLWRSFLVSRALLKFYNEVNVKVKPFHGDGHCGFKPISDISLLLGLIFMLLGFYIILKIYDKLCVFKIPLTSDIGNPVVIAAFALLVPFLLLPPLVISHRVMKQGKQEFLQSILQTGATLTHPSEDKAEVLHGNTIKNLIELEKLRYEYERNIPVWPLTLKGFAITGISGILIPLSSFATTLVNIILETLPPS